MSKTKCLKLKKKILGGLMLAIDPTSGSVNHVTRSPSKAGWALFKEGGLIDSGTIDIKSSDKKEERFRDLIETLQQFDEDYDILALEDIPMVRGRGSFNISQTLIQACGVYIAGLPGELVEMNSNTWQAVAKRLGGWDKSDEGDAIYIGLSCIAFAEGYDAKFSEKKKLEFLGELIDTYSGWNLPGLLECWEDA